VKKSAAFVSILAVLVLFPACKEESLSVDTETTIPVRTAELVPKPIREYVTATGTAFAIQEMELKTEQAGRYTLQVNPRTGASFRMNDRVKKGEILVSLENPEFVNQVAFDAKKLQRDSAEREYTNQKSVYETGGITLKELTDAERAFIDSKYGFENAVLSLKKLEVTAPFDGVIVGLPHFSGGQWVDANVVVAHVMDYSRLYSELTLPGKEMARLVRGQSVLVSDYSSPDTTATGTVDQISPALDPESRMFALKIVIPNPGLELKPGGFIKADIVVQEKESALVIPKNIILARRGAKTVFVVDRGVALERRIETGIENVDEAEVVSGLQPSDRIVTEGFETLRNRSRVKVIE
jgi:membrane fusion protein (multidrug efflux system)